MSGCCLPVLNPLLANSVRSFDEFAARDLSARDHYDNPGVEFSLGVFYIGLTQTFRGNHVFTS